MKKLLVFFLIIMSFFSKAQSPIPAIVVQDTTILAAYSGTNNAAYVKDTTSGGTYLFDGTGTYTLPNGNGTVVSSVRNSGTGRWVRISSLGSGGGGSTTWESTLDYSPSGSDLFENHTVNSHGNNFEWDSVSNFNIYSGDIDFTNPAAQLSLNSTSFNAYTQNGANSSYFSANANTASIFSSDNTNQSILNINRDGTIEGFATNSIDFNTGDTASYIYLKTGQTFSSYADVFANGDFGDGEISSGNSATDAAGGFSLSREITKSASNEINLQTHKVTDGSNTRDVKLDMVVPYDDTQKPYFQFSMSGNLLTTIRSPILFDGNNYYFPLSVNGNYADNTGNIDISTSFGLSGTKGSVVWWGSNNVLRENNPKFFWDSANARLGIGTTTPRATQEINGNIYVADTITTTGDVNHDRVSQYKALTTSGGAGLTQFPNSFYSENKTSGSTDFTSSNSAIMAGQSNMKLGANITITRANGFLGRLWAVGGISDSVTTAIGAEGGIDAGEAGNPDLTVLNVNKAFGIAGSTFQEKGTINADTMAYIGTLDHYTIGGTPNWTENIQNKFSLFLHDYTTGGHNDWGIYQQGISKINSLDGAIIMPRLTAAQRDALTPVAGYTLYCTDCTATDASTGVMQTYNGSTWKNYW